MLFFYSSSTSSVRPFFTVSPTTVFIQGSSFLSSYKERFVISDPAQGVINISSFCQEEYTNQLRCLFCGFFTTYFADDTSPATHFTKGISIHPQDVLQKILRQRRTFLLQFGQRRVCTRASVWFSTEVWRRWTFDSLGSTIHDVALSRYTYRHLARSDFYKAGVLVSHPNFYLFVYLLTNPYLWGVLQQTLHSHYRYK